MKKPRHSKDRTDTKSISEHSGTSDWYVKYRNIVILILILAAFIPRFYLATVSPVDDDETWYLYDSYNVHNGMVPYKDFHTRSPFLLYSVSAFISVMGDTILAGRMVSVISGTLIALGVYFLTRKLYSERAAVFAAFLFALFPFTIRWSSTLATEPEAAALSVWAVYLFIVEYNQEQGLNRFTKLLSSGLLMFLGVLTRRSVALIPLAMYTGSLIYTYSNKVPSPFFSGIRRVSSIGYGFFGPVTLFYLLLTYETSFQYAWYMYVAELWDQAPLFPFLHWNISSISIYAYGLAVVTLMTMGIFLTRPVQGKLRPLLLGLALSIVPLMLMAVLQADFTDMAGIKFLRMNLGYSMLVWPILPLLILLPLTALASSGAENEEDFISPFAVIGTTSLLTMLVLLGYVKLGDDELRPLLFIWLILFSGILIIGYIEVVKKGYDRASWLMFRILEGSIFVPVLTYMVVVVVQYPAVIPVLLVTGGILLVLLILGLIVKGMLPALVTRSVVPLCWASIFVVVVAALVHPLSLGGSWPYVIMASAIIVLTIYRPHPYLSILAFLVLSIQSIFDTWSFMLLAPTLVPITVLFLTRIKEDRHTVLTTEGVHIFLPVILIFFTLFYISRNWIMPIYFFELTPYTAVLAGAVLDKLWTIEYKNEESTQKKALQRAFLYGRPQPGTTAALFLLIILVSTSISAATYGANTYYTQENTEFYPHLSTVNDVAKYIDERTEPGESILAWPIYAYAANRPMVLNISRPYGYMNGYVNVRGYPSVPEVIKYMDSKGVRFVVMDINLKNYWLNSDKRLDFYIAHNYILVRTFDGVDIYQRAGDIDAS